MALSMPLPSVTEGDVSVQRKLVSAFRYEAAEGLRPIVLDQCAQMRKVRKSKRAWVLYWSHPPGSNRRPADYESAALPTELGWLFSPGYHGKIIV